ncbi:MAG: VWA domain-containing protein, partial [Ktedonobacterales bacterium]
LHHGHGRRFAVVLADGMWNDQPRAVSRAKRCHAAQIQIIAIGFGGADRAFLAQIASSSEQSFFTDLHSLTETFGTIARDLSAATANARLGGGPRTSGR